MKALNQSETKQKNKNLILKLIITNNQISRIDLSKITGLTKMAVSNIVGELISEGIVEELGVTESNLGRKPIGLGLVDYSRVVIGIYISRNKLCAFAGDIKGNVLFVNELPLSNETNDSLTQKLFDLLDEVVVKTKEYYVIGIGISCIGPLSSNEGIILNPPNFYSVKNLPINQILEERYKMPVMLNNDMNTSALAEKYYGNGKSTESFIYVGVTNGVGAGIISGHKLYSGSNGFAGEFGHICVDIHGKQCLCGNKGCLELYSSFPENWDTLTQIEKDEKLDVLCEYLSMGLITLINLFDPQMIVIGHEIAKCGESAVEKLSKAIENHYMSSSHKKINVAVSVFGENSPICGAIALVTHRFLS